ncbi:hypothetical protein BsWGS_24696 [Bradybaena similaris]
MLVLFESAAGYALFKLLNESKLHNVDNLYREFESPEKASKILKLKHFEKFENINEAVAANLSVENDKVSKNLKRLVKKHILKDAEAELAIADAKLGKLLKKEFDLNCVTNSSIQELMRNIRSQLDSFISPLVDASHLAQMSLGLAHSLSRYRLKFSPDKVDTMIVQAVCDRTNAAKTDLSAILPEHLEKELKWAAEISMGTEIASEDIFNIKNLCDQVIEMSKTRDELYSYLKERMSMVAPNLTVLVGELVGARLIAHAGSLLNLAKHPSSTVQILGAEKALFRALKTKHDTPKYGLIYHASMVGGAQPKHKGKLSRMLAAKASLAIRVDALSETSDCTMGVEQRAKLEGRLRHLDEKAARKISGSGKFPVKQEKYTNVSEVKVFNPAIDSTLKRDFKQEAHSTPVTPLKRKIKEEVDEDQDDTPKQSKAKKIKTGSTEDVEDESPKKKKKKDKRHSEVQEQEVSHEEVQADGDASSKKKKKKKKEKSGDE